ncbi:hypothetical protein AVEN_147868-1 [Araneus ventricosus]|uniref:LysM domain-containing protein n=1 Tax=Araneus ventricosus TaxID=182803 RepID=A0A4Y2RZZ7_ARAVE|nr:hypothetical protein AVEN_147868-1 [Araneus ventricosus]
MVGKEFYRDSMGWLAAATSIPDLATKLATNSMTRYKDSKVLESSRYLYCRGDTLEYTRRFHDVTARRVRSYNSMLDDGCVDRLGSPERETSLEFYPQCELDRSW